jgi:type VII secretion effector (TIGR04197 family)
MSEEVSDYMADDPTAKLGQERARLEDALGKLESAVKGVGERASEEATKLRSEREVLGTQLTTLNSDHDTLNNRLDNVQASYAELEQTIAQVTKRLDATIGQLKSVLD